MSDNRREFDIQAWPGKVWNSPENPSFRFIEVEVIAADNGELAVRWNGALPSTLTPGGISVAQFDASVFVGQRLQFDTGSIGRRPVSLADAQLGGFTARVRTDTEPIGSPANALPIITLPGGRTGVLVQLLTSDIAPLYVAPATSPWPVVSTPPASVAPIGKTWLPADGASPTYTVITANMDKAISVFDMVVSYVWLGAAPFAFGVELKNGGAVWAELRVDASMATDMRALPPLRFGGVKGAIGGSLTLQLQGTVPAGAQVALAGAVTYTQA